MSFAIGAVLMREQIENKNFNSIYRVDQIIHRELWHKYQFLVLRKAHVRIDYYYKLYASENGKKVFQNQVL